MAQRDIGVKALDRIWQKHSSVSAARDFPVSASFHQTRGGIDCIHPMPPP